MFQKKLKKILKDYADKNLNSMEAFKQILALADGHKEIVRLEKENL